MKIRENKENGKMQHVFLVGAKSLGAYGGYETFINKLTEYHQSNPDIKYHVAVKANGQGASVPDGVKVVDGRYTYHNADCFQIKIPEKLGPAQAIYYDCAALKKSIEIIKEEKISNPIVYIMTCRIGPFFNSFCRAIHKLGGRVFLNPDGECEIIWTTRKSLISCGFTRLDLFTSTCFCLSWCVTASVISGANGFWLRSILNPSQRKLIEQKTE